MDAESTQALSIANLFEASRDQLFRYAVSLSKRVDRADDLIQETFLRALRHARTLERMNVHQREAWLKRVLRNRYFDEERSRKRANAAAIEMIRQAHRPVDTRGLVEFGEILDRIPEQYHAVLEKKYRLGMNSSEIGKELGIPAATVRSHLCQAIRWLRSQMIEPTR